MIDLYYWPTSNGRKITIMLHEVELPYNIIPVNFKIGEQYAPAYLKINPNNKIPALVDHDPQGGGAPIDDLRVGRDPDLSRGENRQADAAGLCTVATRR